MLGRMAELRLLNSKCFANFTGKVFLKDTCFLSFKLHYILQGFYNFKGTYTTRSAESQIHSQRDR